LLFGWQRPIHAGAIVVSLLVQLVLMRRLLKSPRELAPWYNGTGVSLYVLGMLVAAFALAGLGA
jgi:chlorophyll synthase